MKLSYGLLLSILLISNPALAQIKICGNEIGIDSCTQGTERFMSKGVDYQPEENVDPISDDKLGVITNNLIPALKKMGANIIRVYQVCPGGHCASHDQVMNALKENNIKVFVGLADYKNGTQCTVDRSTGNYPQSLYDCFTKKIDAFSKYPNVLGFSVGNEVWDIPGKTDDNYLRPSATMKAVIRDMKAYIKEKNYNKPVGIVLRDVPDVTIPMAYYYACHLKNESKDTSADFIGYNVYRWGEGKDPGNYPSLLNNYKGYRPVLLGQDGDKLKNGFKGINVPVILTEYGRVDKPRLFKQVDWMFDEGAPVISGGMVFRMIQRSNEAPFGLYEDTNLKTPTTNGGLDNLIEKYNASPALLLGPDSKEEKITCDAATYPDIDKFQLDPTQLPTAGGGEPGTHELLFNVGDLKLPLENISINYQDNSGWQTAYDKSNPSNIFYSATIPNPKDLKAIGINFNGTNGACLVKPANQLCKNANCSELYSISAAWSSNGQGQCKINK